MKLAKAITKGFGRASRSLKAILIIWLFNLIAVALLAGPLKTSLISEVGSSLGTNMISEGFSIDFWTGLNPVMMSSLLGLLKGFLMLFITYIFLGAFLNGGLFDSLRVNVFGYRLKDFFRASAANFFSFLAASLLVMLMILFAVGIFMGLPMLILRGSGGGDVGLTKVFGVSRIVLILVLPVFFLVADYARAWLSANEDKKVFKALGYGFKATFRSFFSSYFFMLILVTLQAGFLFLVSKAINFFPSTTGGLFVMFLFTQALFIIKLFLRSWRYGGVITLHTLG